MMMPPRPRRHPILLLLISWILLSKTAVVVLVVAFAASPKRPSTTTPGGGGFGGQQGFSQKKQKKKKTNLGTTTTTTTSTTSRKVKDHGAIVNLNSAEGLMAYIRSRIELADVSVMSRLSLQTDPTSNQICLDVDPNSICVVDNFLGNDELIRAMRKEAESLLPEMIPSQSTRWDEIQQTVVPYDKRGVLSTQIEGGGTGYQKSPRLIEYIVTLTKEMSQKLNAMLPPSHHLSGTEQTNKLAVCLGGGSSYDKHIDNMGGGDRRKLTALLYLQPPGSHDGQPDYPKEHFTDDPRGGYFRAYDVPQQDSMIFIAPRGDRLILFWSDSLVHDVSPSYTTTLANYIVDRRWALTTWFVLADKEQGKIRPTDPIVQQRHFS